MRAILPTRGLKRTLTTLSKVVPTRSPKPILQCVRLVLTDDASCAEGTDLEIWTRAEIESRIEAPGVACVNARDLAKALPDPKADPDIVLETDGGWLLVKGKQSTRRLKLEDAESFPAFPDHATEHGSALVDASDWIKAVERALPHVDPDSTRYALGGVYVEWQPDGLIVTGCNGRTLATTRIHAQRKETGHVCNLISARHAAFVAGLARGGADPILYPVKPESQAKLGDATHALLAMVGDWTVFMSPVIGRYPPYRDVISATHDSQWDIEAGALLDLASDACKAATDGTGRGMELRLAAGRISARVVAGESIVWESSAPCVQRSEINRAAITLDCHYVHDAVKPIASAGRDQYIRFALDEPKKGENECKWTVGPVTIQTDDGTRVVIMPLSRDSDPWQAEPAPAESAPVADAPIGASVEPEPEPEPAAVAEPAISAGAARQARYRRYAPDAIPASTEIKRRRLAKLARVSLANKRDARAARHAKLARRCQSWGIRPDQIAEETDRRLGLARHILAQSRAWRTRKARYARLDPVVWTDADPMRIEKVRQDMARGPARLLLEQGRIKRAERRQPEPQPEPAPVLDLSTLTIDINGQPADRILEQVHTEEAACSFLACCYVPSTPALPAPVVAPKLASAPELIRERMAFSPPAVTSASPVAPIGAKTRPAPDYTLAVNVTDPKGRHTLYHCTVLELGRSYRLEHGDSDYRVDVRDDGVPECDCPHHRHHRDNAHAVVCKHIRGLRDARLLAPAPEPATPNIPTTQEDGREIVLAFPRQPHAHVASMLRVWHFVPSLDRLTWRGPSDYRSIKHALGLANLIARGRVSDPEPAAV